MIGRWGDAEMGGNENTGTPRRGDAENG